MKQVFVIIPKLKPDGPMKGAAALCNGLAGRCSVHLVSISRSEQSVENELDEKVAKVRLEEFGTWLAKVKKLNTEVRKAGKSGKVTLISFSLKADMLSLSVTSRVKRISRVSANLMKNYEYDFGMKGKLAAFAHFQLLRLFDSVITMSDSMTGQLKRYGVKRTEDICNFINETALDKHRKVSDKRDSNVNFLFLGSLTKRKRPELLINAAVEVVRRGGRCRVDIVGDGPLRAELENLIKINSAEEFITLHGYLEHPYSILGRSDYMVLPSESEGTSRAVMEALYLGVPCILRDVDGNSEIITKGVNGELFRNDSELIDIIADRAMNVPKDRRGTGSLLPDEYRQSSCTDKYMELLA